MKSKKRRLAYVAFTRAQKDYILVMPLKNAFRYYFQKLPSRFIKEIEPDLIEKIDNTVKATTGAIAVTTVSSIPLQKQIAKIKSNEPSKQPVEIDFAEGDRVKHNIFGEGTVISVRKMANDAMLEVDFDKVGTKKLMANFAKINKIDNN